MILNKNSLATSVGNILEWYDFCLYGYFAPLLATAFFPEHDRYIALMYVFLSFASGYIVRPLGGIIFGHLGDSIGVGRSLYCSLLLIAFPTFIIGLLPTYSEAGKVGAILLVTIRLLQGLSAGGQYSGSLVLLRNQHSENQGARATSIAYLASLCGFLLASCAGTFSTHLFDNSFSWRMPFLLALIFIFILPFCKKYLAQGQQQKVKIHQKLPIKLLFNKHKMCTLKTSLLASVGGIYYCTFFVFLVTYLRVYIGIDMSVTLLINTICLISSGISIFYFAWIADKYGRKPVILFASIALALLIYPAFFMLNSNNFIMIFLAAWMLTTANTAFMAAVAVVYVEMFHQSVQFTGCAISYNIGAGIVGGLTPFFLVFLLERFNTNIMIGFLFLTALCGSILIYFFIPETKRRTLR